LHCLRWINPSIEAKLSSHLSISYTAPSPASSTAAAAGPAAGTATKPDTSSPLDFLSALIDHLMAGDKAAATDPVSATTTAADTTPPPSVTGLFNLNADTGAATDGPPPQGVALIAKLGKDLNALQAQIDAGQKPDKDLLKDIGDTADALAAMLQPAQSRPTTPVATLDPLKTIEAAASPSTGDQPDIPGTKPADQPAAGTDPVTQLLASMGITLPAQNATAAPPATAATPSTPLPAIAELSSRLSQLSAAIAPMAPDVAQKLTALTQKLDAAEADPKILAQLAGTSDSDGTSLDQIVQQLMSAKATPPAPAMPQLAANTKLPVPDPLTAKAGNTNADAADTTPAPAPADPLSATAKPSLAPVTVVQAKDSAPADKKDDAKVAATASVVAAAATKADAADTTQASAAANAQSATAPVAQTAAARAIPAAYQAASNPINMGQVAFEMAKQMHQGTSRFTIRIDPPELGRVDVKMHVDSAGNVNARLTVERSETLDMFQRDKGSLEKALTQAGLDTGKTNLEFSLKQNPFAGMTGGDQRQSGGYSFGARSALSSNGDDDAAIPAITLYRGTASVGGVNIFA
jgi:flagellar hook-length control protein FliK